jgi:assimilatory nitrate reductase catalytic subunit
MAKLPLPIDEIVQDYGPHPRYMTPRYLGEPDKLVDTHCCFCGQQCGITLKVKDNKVIGFEPREDWPFNRGKLCPKGIKRYLQSDHPDRLLHPLRRTEAGFVPVSWDEALDTTVGEIKRIQKAYGKDSFAMLSGVSLTNEKSYLAGKFARVALQTANLDYNGRLCMVSAGAGNKKAFGIDRAANYWDDIPLADVILVTGANVAECAPITTDYIWRARDRGAKLIMIDPRVTPLARTADLHIPIRPGGDSALMNGILHVCIERGWVDQAYIDNYTSGFADVKETVKKYTPEYAGKIAGVDPTLIVKAAEMWGPAKTSFLLHSRGIEHHTKGVENVLTCINLVLATGRLGRPGCGYATITGQGNGQGGREHGHKCDQLPGNRDITNPEHRKYIAEVWGILESEMPGKGNTAQEIIELMHSGDIKGLLSICFNPVVSLPNATFTKEAFNRLEHYSIIDFFLSETAAMQISSCQVRFRKKMRERLRVRKAASSIFAKRSIHLVKRVWIGISSSTSPSVWGAVSISRTRLRKIFSMSCALLPKAVRRTISVSPMKRSTRIKASSGLARHWIIPVRRGCSKTINFTRRIKKRTSTLSSIDRPQK